MRCIGARRTLCVRMMISCRGDCHRAEEVWSRMVLVCVCVWVCVCVCVWVSVCVCVCVGVVGSVANMYIFIQDC